MLKPGTILDDRYEIIDVVGTGGMSTVYRAKDERLRRFVAIKVLKSDYSSDQNFVSKFRAEAQSSAGLTHPNIVSVYDVCEDDGRYFIVMELVEGITLKEYINLNGRLNMNQAIDFSIQIASGLEAAHEHHVIHRDIKPQNIIVSKSGNIKVTDFGIAKAATSTTMSTTGIGSVHYISPEQARGGYSDERSDIYSLGITMYEMVTGRVPFEGDTNVAIALMHIQNEMIQPRELYPDIYPSFEKIILKATQKKPERRYLTAAALIADLNRVKDNPNIDIIVATPTVPGAPTQQFTNEDMQKIKNGSAIKGVANHDYVGDDTVVAPASSEVSPDRSRIEAILKAAEQEEYDDYEEEAPRRPEHRKTNLKKVDDEEDEEYYRPSRDREEDEDEDDVDPKLEKAVMIGGIAAAVIVAVLLFVFIGNMAGWFDFGKKKEEATTTETTTEEVTEEVKMIEMPDVVGLSQKAAEKSLKEVGLNNFKFVEENSTDVKEGYVISQNVEAKTQIPKDTQLIITVSSGAEELEVTDVKGMDEDEAFEILEKQGFKPTRSYKFDDEMEKGKVISTDPKAGSKLKAGETIIMYVSEGKEEKIVEVPDLTGLTEATAKGKLESAGLKVGQVNYEYNSDVPEGEVFRQSVAAKTEVKEGTTVDFVISKGAEKKSYRGKVKGSISTDDEDLWDVNVKVTVFIADDSGTYLAFQTSDSGDTIKVKGTYEGLSYNNGTVTFIVETEDGEDVTSSYSQDITLSYEEM
ncbi:MAG: Stk1 family PASTA domain-containing Ser/Thr kinase [Eubacterium sp.]|nr:Stk1 family PASTA domain-containing Ser/Thr kinase [Eubacterium sp.]